jgi:hypothetical protein
VYDVDPSVVEVDNEDSQVKANVAKEKEMKGRSSEIKCHISITNKKHVMWSNRTDLVHHLGSDHAHSLADRLGIVEHVGHLSGRAMAASAPSPCLKSMTDDDPTHGIGIIQVLPIHSRHLGERVESPSTVPVSHGTFQLSQRVSGIR